MLSYLLAEHARLEKNLVNADEERNQIAIKNRLDKIALEISVHPEYNPSN